jgi:hypothetical protein
VSDAGYDSRITSDQWESVIARQPAAVGFRNVPDRLLDFALEAKEQKSKSLLRAKRPGPNSPGYNLASASRLPDAQISPIAVLKTSFDL